MSNQRVGNPPSLALADEATRTDGEAVRLAGRPERDLARELWAGTGITTQTTTSRIDSLLKVGDETTCRFLSVEPQVEPIDLRGVAAEIGASWANPTSQ